MKPRNKYEKRVAEINATLSEDIAIANLEWAKKESYKCDMGRGNYIYFVVAENDAEFEVKRLYRLYRFDDKNTSHFFCMEIMREFIDGDKHTYCAKKRDGMSSYYYDVFTPHSDIELKRVCKNWAGYEICDLTSLSIGSQVREAGERVDCLRENPKELARLICNNPIVETMYKNNEPIFQALKYRTYIPQICRAYVIAKRHGFVFDMNTIPLWVDMVYSIIKLDKDWHNPVFIAPADILEAHNKFMHMWERKEARIKDELRRRREAARHEREVRELKEQLEKDERANKAYIKRRKRFYDMVLTDGLIECRVLPDVKAFEDEGRIMDHCVFRMRYFERPYSLILSARIAGKRIETVEVNLTNYTIHQCYGKSDHFTCYHQRILDLVNSQMGTIKEFNNKRTRSTKVKAA